MLRFCGRCEFEICGTWVAAVRGGESEGEAGRGEWVGVSPFTRCFLGGRLGLEELTYRFVRVFGVSLTRVRRDCEVCVA